MFRLLKLGVTTAALAAFAWFGITVKLGSQTLFQHLRSIGQTKESQDLVEGTRQAAEPLVDDVRRRISGKLETSGGASPPARPGASPRQPAAPEADDRPARSTDERLSSAERRQLRELLRKVDP